MKKITFKKIVWPLILLVVVGLIVGAGIVLPNQPDKLDGFASCLKDKGATFYGAFWCPHCQNQEALFGRSERLLPYIECSNPDQSSTQVCIDKNIISYPTWVFSGGFTVNSSSAPKICENGSKVPECQNLSNPYYKVWLFPNLVAGSTAEPTQKNDIWTFPPDSRLLGEIPLATFAAETGCELPK